VAMALFQAFDPPAVCHAFCGIGGTGTCKGVIAPAPLLTIVDCGALNVIFCCAVLEDLSSGGYCLVDLVDVNLGGCKVSVV